MQNRFSRCVAIAIPAVLLAAAAACTKKDEAPKDTLQIQLSSEPVSLDPSLAEDGLGFRILINVMDGLVGYTNEGRLVNRLAESYEISEDRKTYRFKLRPDAVWSDGAAVDASQFKLALERALKPATGSKLSGLLRVIRGASDLVRGTNPHASGIVADGRDLTITLEKPASYFLQVLTLPIAYPLRADVLERNGGRWDALRGDRVPTNGAYKFAGYARDQRIELTAHQRLPDGAPRNVLLRIVQDESTGASLFERGKLDVLSRIPAYDQKKYEEKGQVRVVPFLATYFLGFNLKKPPFNDRDFRRALAGAIKKEELVRALGTGETPASSWIPRGLEGYYPYRADAAGVESVFADSVARVKARKYPGKIVMGFDSSGRNALVMEKVQSDARAALGWKVELANSDWKSFTKSIYVDPTPVFRFGWSTPMIDPVIFLSAFTTKDPFTFTSYSNPAYDGLVARIVALEPGDAERARLIAQAQKILVEDEAIVIPLYHYVSTQVVGPRLAKYEVSPFGHTRYEEVRLK